MAAHGVARGRSSTAPPLGTVPAMGRDLAELLFAAAVLPVAVAASCKSAAREAPDAGEVDASFADAAAIPLASIQSIDVDPGRTVSKSIVAATGGTIALPDGATLLVPPGALPMDTVVTVTIPTLQGPLGTEFVYLIAPAGIALSQPATLTVPITPLPTEDTPLFAYASSILTPTASAGDELTNWTVLAETGEDETASTVSFAVNDFTFLYLAVEAGAHEYMVTDIPGVYLHPADLLYGLTTLAGGSGPNWQPGHVAAFTGPLATSDRTASSRRTPRVSRRAASISSRRTRSTSARIVRTSAGRAWPPPPPSPCSPTSATDSR
jgi:hypothetical protein